MAMLENPRLVLTIDLPPLLSQFYFTGLEHFYCKWVNWWVEYGDKDWLVEAKQRHWDDCDDTPDDVSRHHYALELLTNLSVELQEYFEKLVSDITYDRLPSQIVVKPTKMKGVVLWSII